VAELTVEPGCEDIEVSLVNFETGRDGRRLGGTRTSTGGTLPFTGAGLAPVLLLAGAAFSLAGVATLYGTRAARRARGA
jgi:hypothetical protein